MSFRQCFARFVVAAVVLGTMVPAGAAAEDDGERPIYAPTDEQLELNERGVEALIEGRAARAVALLTEAYRLGEVNILALNLGRAHHALGNCEEARDKLTLVAELPVIEHPPPERIEERADEYLEDVEETCRDDQEIEVDDPDELETEPGEDEAVERQEQPDEQDQPEEVEPLDPPSDVEDDQRSWWAENQRGVGMITAVSGVVAASGGGVLHLVARQQHDTLNDQVRGDDDVVTDITQNEYRQQQAQIGRLDTIGVATGAVGVAAIAAGALIWMTADDAEEPSAQLDVSVGHDGAGIDWIMRF